MAERGCDRSFVHSSFVRSSFSLANAPASEQVAACPAPCPLPPLAPIRTPSLMFTGRTHDLSPSPVGRGGLSLSRLAGVPLLSRDADARSSDSVAAAVFGNGS